ncbi:MAG: winged helix-turn-helix domain-containing protein [Lachnospiraceae bacterium]|nr:winged helix-turn-helix domain-containing protein [Lachnospiraceae bacterium]
MDDLLSIMTNSEQITMQELSEQLNMSIGLIFARLERYEQLGYVKRIVEKGSEGCSGTCSGCKGCGSHKPEFKPSIYWVKGEKLANLSCK